MKNVLIITNLTSVIISIFIIYLYFNLKSKIDILAKQKHPKKIQTSSPLSSNNNNNNIAFVDIEYFQNQSSLFNNLEKKLQGKQNKFQSQLNSKAKKLEKQISEFKKNATRLSQFEVQLKQQELAKKQQELYEYDNKLKIELQNEQIKLNQDLFFNLNNYIQETYKNSGYEIILGKSALGVTLLKYNRQNDITQDVVMGMNSLFSGK